MLQNDGEFLVRQSSGDSNQYVLSGRQNGAVKHLLLVDPAGVVGYIQPHVSEQRDFTNDEVVPFILHTCLSQCTHFNILVMFFFISKALESFGYQSSSIIFLLSWGVVSPEITSQ